MNLFRLLLILVLPLPAMAQTPSPSALGQSVPRGGAAVSTAPAAPVVQAKPNTRVQAAKPRPHTTTNSSARPPGKTAAKPGSAAPAKPGEPAAASAPAEPPKPAEPAENNAIGSVTKLPTPRFMSLGFNEVNLRVGPGLRYPTDWVYRRKDLPVEVLRELDEWRLVRDQDNVRGWVRASTLSARRGFVVREVGQVLRSHANDDASAVAMLKPGVVGRLRGCAADNAWCEVDVATYRGWLKRDAIYGAYPNELVGG